MNLVALVVSWSFAAGAFALVLLTAWLLSRMRIFLAGSLLTLFLAIQSRCTTRR